MAGWWRPKRCGHCGSDDTLPLPSRNEFICQNCKKTSRWKLSKGQVSPLQDRKVGGIDDN